jgi:hypothetical protein
MPSQFRPGELDWLTMMPPIWGTQPWEQNILSSRTNSRVFACNLFFVRTIRLCLSVHDELQELQTCRNLKCNSSLLTQMLSNPKIISLFLEVCKSLELWFLFMALAGNLPVELISISLEFLQERELWCSLLVLRFVSGRWLGATADFLERRIDIQQIGDQEGVW